MALTDTSILDWQQDFLTDDTNTPPDVGTTISKLLDDEARVCKSVIRAECDAKAWERWGLAATYISATSYSHVGDERTVAQPNRRVKATYGGGTLYGRILTSVFATGITTVTVDWDREPLTGFTVTADSAILWAADLTKYPRFTVGDIVELALAASDPKRVQRKVAGSGPVGAASAISFDAAAPWIVDLVARAPTRVYVKSLGVTNPISEVQYGLFTPVNFQSGMADDLITGTFNVTFDGTHDTFTIALPVTMHNAGYHVQIQPTGIISGVPVSDWTKPEHNSSTTTTFNVKFPSVLAAGATVSFDYVLQRDQ